MFFNSPLWIGLVVVALLISLIVFSVRPMLAFAIAAAVLFLSDAISQTAFLSGFINQALISLILLLLCSLAVEKTVFVKNIGKTFFTTNKVLNLVKQCVSSVFASGITNNTAVVSVIMASINQNKLLIPSRLLLPLSYASILGGTLTLVGTSTNMIVAGFVEDAGLPVLNMFSTTPIAIFVIVSCLIIMIPAALFLLPSHQREDLAVNAYFIETKVAADSKLIGKSVINNGFRNLNALYLAEVIREGVLYSPVEPSFKIQANDKLLFVGDLNDLAMLNQFDGLLVLNESLASINNNLVEVVITADASISGKTIKQSDFRSQFNASVVGVRRGEQKLSGGLGRIILKPGDALLLAVGSDFQNRHNLKNNFIVLSSEYSVSCLDIKKSTLVLLGFLAVLGAASLSLLPLMKGLMLLLGVYVASGVIGFSEIRRRLPFEILIVVGSALAIAHAMFESGLATMLGDILLTLSQGYGVWGAFVAVYLVTLLLTELITNNAAAALIFPISIALTEHFGVSYMPFVMAVMFGASASFLSPFGYQTNLMVFSVGKYKIIDYIKFGLPISLTYSVTVLWVIPLIYPF